MLSISHLIIIFLVALIVFGPEKLPELARTLSKLMREFNRATGGLRESLEQDLRQLEREVLEQRQAPAATPVAAPAMALPEAASTGQSPAPPGDATAASAPPESPPSPSATLPDNAADGHPTAA